MKKKQRSVGRAFCGGLRIFSYLTTAVAVIALITILVYVIVGGVGKLKPSLFGDGSEGPTIVPAIVGTLSLVGISLVIAVPLGMGAAIFLAEYANVKGKFVKVVRIATETLAGIPSIVYGLFGYLVFVVAFKMG